MIRPLLLISLLCAPVCFAQQSDAILPGRPDAKVATGGDELGVSFSSLAAGISFRPPGGMEEIRRPAGDELIAIFLDNNRKWQLKVSRLVLTTAAPLQTDTEPDPKTKITRIGLLESNVEQMKVDTGATEVLRQDVINIADLPCGMIAARYNVSADTAQLTQRAVVQAGEDEKLYYVFELNTPAPLRGDLTADENVRSAVSVFGKMLDSIRLLDQRQVMQDQNERLFRTRALITTLNETTLRQALHKEQWLLISRAGKPLGYTYIVERTGSDIPRSGQDPNTTRSANDGVLIGVRTRTVPDENKTVDAESWMWMSFDRKHEVWSNILFTDEPDPVDKTKRRRFKSGGEFGSADSTVERVRDDRLEIGEKRPDGTMDQNQPAIRQQEIVTLSVTPVNLGADNQPMSRQLPAFYMPQAAAHLLPRLVAKNEGKTYLVAVYVSDRKEVLKRYLDVGGEREVTFAGKKIRAIAVNDRIGLEGAITTHYISPSGEYLGSENKDTQITLTPTTAAALEQLFAKPDLTAPAEVGRNAE